MEILQKTSYYIADLFRENLSPDYVYHNFQHTLDTVTISKELANHYPEISESSIEKLLLAAWFHDTGYIHKAEDHEEKSIDIAKLFLLSNRYDPEALSNVLTYIEATKKGHAPADLISQILVDANRIDIGKEIYPSKASLLRSEIIKTRGIIYNETDWIKKQLLFLQTNNFYTEAARNIYGMQRQKNIEVLEKKLKKVFKKKEKKKEKEEHAMDARWGIQTMFRSVYRSHINLSSIADGKANIMIRVNSMIISITLTLVGAKFSFLGTSFKENQIIILPIISLLFTGLIAIIFAILSAKPSITHIIRNQEDIKNKNASLLFFGNFSTISIKEYKGGMKNLIESKDDIYESMMTDLYFLGKILTKKYRLITISYIVFMTGLILTTSITIYVVLYLKHMIR